MRNLNKNMCSQATDVVKRKMLVVTPRYPYPVVGGDRLRIFHICKELSKSYDITLVSLCETTDEMLLELPSDGIFQDIIRFHLPKWKSFFSTALSIFSNTPLQVAYYKSSKLFDYININSGNFDVCLYHLIRAGNYVDKSKCSVNILEMTDAISMNYDRVRSHENLVGFKNLIYRFEFSRLNLYEKRAIKLFNLTTLVSAADKKYLLGDRINDNVLVCSNGVDVSKFKFVKRDFREPVIVFIGNMNSIQNMDACLYFAKDVLPLLRDKLKFVFRVVGNIGNSDAERLRSFDGVEVTGRVDDVASVVEDASIGVCPIRLGAGVQNKVLEYMALGIPTITSSVGLEGFSAVPDKHLLVADSPAAYFEKSFLLWNNKDYSEFLSINGRRYVESNHDWGSQLAPMVEKIGDFLSAAD